MQHKQHPLFVAYIRKIVAGTSLLPSTVHDSILEGSHSLDLDGKRRKAWLALCEAVGEDEAKQLVQKWLDKPWKLREGRPVSSGRIQARRLWASEG